MKLKYLSFLFSISFLGSAICMESPTDSTGSISPVDEQEEVIQESLAPTKGKIQLDLLKSKSGKELNQALANCLSMCLFQAKYKVENISNKLREIPLVGQAVRIPGMSFVINKVSSRIASWLFKFDAVIAEKDSLKEKIKKTLEEEIKKDALSEVFCVIGEKKLEPAWFAKEIGFVESKGGMFSSDKLKVSFENHKDLALGDFEKAEPKICEELLCFGVEIAKRKEFLLEAFKIAGTPDILHETLYKQLSSNGPKIEKEIHELFFPGESKEEKTEKICE